MYTAWPLLSTGATGVATACAEYDFRFPTYPGGFGPGAAVGDTGIECQFWKFSPAACGGPPDMGCGWSWTRTVGCSEYEAVGCPGRFRQKRKKAASAMMAMTTHPPTTPPTMAPIGVPDSECTAFVVEAGCLDVSEEVSIAEGCITVEVHVLFIWPMYVVAIVDNSKRVSLPQAQTTGVTLSIATAWGTVKTPSLFNRGDCFRLDK